MPNLEAYKNREIQCPDAPYTLFIEPTNHCNLKCSFCPQKSQKRELGFLDMDLYRKILEDAKQCGVKKFNMFFLGESLMHKNLFEMLSLATSKGIETRLNTNASFLDEKRAELLIEAGLDYLTISFEGVNKEVYERVRVKGNYETTLSNIRSMIRLRDQKKSPVKISIEVIELEETRPFIDDFERRMLDLGPDEVVRKVYRNWVGYLKAKKDLSLLEEYRVCSYPWRSMAMLFDGTFVPCCVDYDGKYPVGHAKDGIMNAWNSKAMLDLRTYLIERSTSLRKSFGKKKCHGLCSMCDIPFQKGDHPE